MNNIDLPKGFVVLKPDEKWVPGMAQPQPIANQETIDKPVKKCTCGIAAIGGGMHSDWCDLYQEQTND